jgi:hypothetical protein
VNFAVIAGEPIAGELSYSQRALSFDFRPADADVDRQAATVVELMIGSVALQVDRQTGDVIGLWGYHPEATWTVGQLEPTSGATGRLRVELDDVPPPGVAIRLAPITPLTTSHDAATGWIRIAIAQEPGTELVEFVSHGIAELAGDQLAALWLLPTRVA